MNKILSIVTIIAVAVALGGETWAASGSDAESARKLVAEGRAALDTDRLGAAVVLFRKAVATDPGNGEAQFDLAICLIKLGDLAEVEQRLYAAQNAGYDQAEIEATLAELYNRLGKYGKVLEFPEGNRRPELEARIRNARGFAQLNLKQLADAEKAFTQGIARAQTGMAQERIISGNFTAAAELLEKAVAGDPTFVDPWILLGRLRSMRDDPKGAREAFDEALRLEPDNLSALIGRATLIIGSDEEQAAKDVAAALARTPDNWEANLLDATIKARHKQWREAEAALMNIAAPEQIPRALYLMARVNLAQGQVSQADANITHYLAIAPGDPQGIAIKAQVLMLRGKPSGAIDLLQQGLAINPRDIGLLGLLSDAYIRNGQNRDAAEALDRLSTIAPDDPDLRLQIARHRLAAGRVDEALQDLSFAKAAEPLSPTATSLSLQALIAAGRLDEASKAVEELRRDQPNSPFSETYLGVIAAKRNDLEGAREHFRKALSLQPSFAMAAIDLAQAFRVEKRDDDARAALDRFLAQDPGNVPVLMARSEIESSAGKTDAAIEFLERARQHDPKAVQPRLDLVAAYIRRGDAAKAAAIAQELDLVAPSDPRTLAARAEAQLANNDRQAAIETFGRLIETTEGAPGPQLRLAEVLTSGGELPAGYRVMRQALSTNPIDPRVQRALFDFSVRNGLVGASIDFVNELAKRRTDDAGLDMLLGQLYENDHRFERAALAYEAGFAKRPDSEFAVATARAQSLGPDPETAFRTLMKWLEQHPDDPAARFLYANLLTQAKQYPQAIAETQRLLAAQPKNPVVLNNLAWLYYLTADPRAAATAAEAHDLAPNSAAIAGTLGWILVEKGELARGVSLLETAAEGSPPVVRYHLAVALSRAGKREEALRVLNELIGSGAQFDERGAAQELLAKLRG